MDVYLRVLVLLVGLITCHCQRCDNNALRRCREDVARQAERRRNDLSTSDCRKFREDFDCLLEQTTLCIRRKEERDEYGNEIEQAHNTLSRNCDRQEGWDRNSCYRREEISRCEDNFPRRIYDADTDTCRKYEDLKSCVERAVNSYCSHNDKAYLKSYYVEIAQNLPWKCASSDGGYDNNHRNRTYVDVQTCCRSERCDDRTRYLNCREDLIQTIEGRSNTYQYSTQQRCTSYLNKFNCLWWHTYNCKEGHEKDLSTMERSRRYIESNCDVTGDLRKSACYGDMEMRDCDRHLSEETPTQSDVTCREFSSFWNCVERALRRCRNEDELLQVFYLINKVDNKAWTCSKRETSYGGYTPYDDRNTYPYGDPYRPSTDMSQDDFICKTRAQRQQRECLSERDRLDDEARREDDTRERRVKGCCAAYTFRGCLRRIVRENCERERSAVVDDFMGSSMRNRISSCQDVDPTTCSASRMLNNAIFILMAVAIFRSILQQ